MAFFNCNKEEIADFKMYYMNPKSDTPVTATYSTTQTSDTICRLILLGNKQKDDLDCLFVDNVRYNRLGMPKEVVQRLHGYWWGR